MSLPVTARLLKDRPDAVLFDWDNTLMNHERLAQSIGVKLIHQLSTPPYPDVREMNRQWADNPAICCQRFFPDKTPEDIKKIWAELMKAVPLEEVQLFPGAKELLDTLKSKKIPMAIVSNKPEDRLKEEIEHLGLTDYFQVIRGDRYDGTPMKPDPKPLIDTIREMGLPLGNIWYAGDMLADAGAARSDGIQRFIVGERHQDLVKARFIGHDPMGKIIYLPDINAFNPYAAQIPAAASGRTL